MISKNGRIQIAADTTDIAENISHWDTRYRHYCSSDLSGVWECRIIRDKSKEILLQFVDRVYEPPRGIKSSDAPIISLSITNDTDTQIIDYRLKQKKSVLLLCLIYFFQSMVILALSIYSFLCNEIPAGVVLICCFAFLFIVAVIWCVRKIQHDSLTVRLFLELFNKNCGCPKSK